MTGPDGSATPAAQRDALRQAAGHVADVVAAGVEVVLTHGNGPQVGNLLVKNELAAPSSRRCRWTGACAQTQATIGFVLADALDAALAARGLPQRTAGAGHPHPGRRRRPRLHRADQADRPLPARASEAGGSSSTARPGRTAASRAGAGSSPRRSRSRSSTRRPCTRWPTAGFVVVCAGGGGIPVVDDGATGRLRGVEAVIDKDLERRAARPATSAPTCWSSPPTSRTSCSATARPQAAAARPGDAPPSCGSTPPRATSRAARWARRSRRPAGSSSTAAAAP